MKGPDVRAGTRGCRAAWPCTSGGRRAGEPFDSAAACCVAVTRWQWRTGQWRTWQRLRGTRRLPGGHAPHTSGDAQPRLDAARLGPTRLSPSRLDGSALSESSSSPSRASLRVGLFGSLRVGHLRRGVAGGAEAQLLVRRRRLPSRARARCTRAHALLPACGRRALSREPPALRPTRVQPADARRRGHAFPCLLAVTAGSAGAWACEGEGRED